MQHCVAQQIEPIVRGSKSQLLPRARVRFVDPVLSSASLICAIKIHIIATELDAFQQRQQQRELPNSCFVAKRIMSMCFRNSLRKCHMQMEKVPPAPSLPPSPLAKLIASLSIKLASKIDILFV